VNSRLGPPAGFLFGKAHFIIFCDIKSFEHPEKDVMDGNLFPALKI